MAKSALSDLSPDLPLVSLQASTPGVVPRGLPAQPSSGLAARARRFCSGTGLAAGSLLAGTTPWVAALAARRRLVHTVIRSRLAASARNTVTCARNTVTRARRSVTFRLAVAGCRAFAVGLPGGWHHSALRRCGAVRRWRRPISVRCGSVR